MEQAVTDYFIGQFGAATIVWLILLGVVVIIVWKLASGYTKKSMQVDNLPCQKHEENIDKLTENMNNIKVVLGKLETGQDDIHKMMVMMTASSPQSVFTQSHSPISLTAKGKEIARTLKLDEMLDRNWDKIGSMIDNEKNPYDIQMEFISKFIVEADKYLEPESLDSIKNDAFRRGVPLIDYMRMLGVMARDRYFTEHGIDISEVDHNDPNVN